MRLRVRRGSSLPVLVALTVAVLVGWSPRAQGEAQKPALPAKQVSPVPPEGGRTVALKAGADLQAALNSVRAGDTLVLDAGATWTGNFVLPRRNDGGWVTIRSSASSDLPAGQRVSPASTGSMPKILTPNSSPAITGNDGTHGWRFIGLEIGVVRTWGNVVYSLMGFGWGSGPHGRRTPTDEVTSRIIVERCYIHGSPSQKVQKGIAANAADIRIADSWIDEIHNSGADSQAILMYDTPGPILIENNELQASSENIMSGGADSSRQDLLPSDIVIRRNHIIKPLRWKSDDPSFDGLKWVIKPLVELKAAQRVLIEGNVLENSWLWPAFVADAFNQEHTAPWSIVQDVTFQHNEIKNSVSVFQAWAGNAPVKRIRVFNNNATGIRYRMYQPIGPSYALGTFFYLIGAEDVAIEHNTGQPLDRGTGSIEGRTSNRRLTIKNNVFGYGHGGFLVTGSWRNDDAAVAATAPEPTIMKNALVNMGDALGKPAIPYQQGRWNSAGWILTGTAEASGLDPDGTLKNGPLKRAATDGTDLGVDFAALTAARGASSQNVSRSPAAGGGTGSRIGGSSSFSVGSSTTPPRSSATSNGTVNGAPRRSDTSNGTLNSAVPTSSR